MGFWFERGYGDWFDFYFVFWVGVVYGVVEFDGDIG